MPFVIQVGAAAALLGAGVPGQAQTGAGAVPGKERLIVRSPRPLNLEAPFTELTGEITPGELFFVRNNYDGPEMDPAQYVLRVDGEVENPLTLRLDDLRRMEQVTQTITLECAGNGREVLQPQGDGHPVGTGRGGHGRLAGCPPGGRPPDGEAAADGPARRPERQRHPTDPAGAGLHPESPDREGDGSAHAARPGDERETRPHLHGGPVRLIVPGWVGSASIKWLTQLTLAEQEWGGPFMARSYRSPRVDDDKQTYSLQSLECKSVIIRPVDGAPLQSGPQTVFGFAWAGEGTVVAVDVSTDGGQSWKPARLTGEEHRYAWRRWEFARDAPSGAQTIMARASDSMGRYQPASRPRDPQGYRWNVIHGVRVNVA